MSENTKIEWTDVTWNPVTGCTRASAGCDNCYAVTMTKRLEAMGQEKYSGLVNLGKNHFNGVVKTHEDALTIPLKWKQPRKVFVNSMSDLFHKEIPFEFIDKVFAVMALTPQHTYQVLTKRPERMAEYLTRTHESYSRQVYNTARTNIWTYVQEAWDCGTFDRGAICPPRTSHRPFRWVHGADDRCTGEVDGWPLPNVWLGTSVEDQKTADERIPHLLNCPAKVRFLSCEPLLGPVDLSDLIKWCPEHDFDGGFCVGPCRYRRYIHWVICGGESGPNARPMHPAWARSLRDQCVRAEVPFFFKQFGEWLPGHHYTPELLKADPDPAGSRFTCAEWCGHEWNIGYRTAWDTDHEDAMYRVGKKAAGRVLDGRTWDEFPRVGA
jgi:protein gp37